ncbi:MAG: hypothetical protein WBB22_17540, partial [Anaerolineae bacterium]
LITGLVASFGASGVYSPTGAQGLNKVGLVVRFSDTEVFTTCVDYEPGLTGEGVLDQAGLSIAREIYGGLGAAICKIEDVGCDYPPESCFCQCTGEPPCEYWAYYYLDQQNNEWVYSGMGASWHTVQPGDVEGWSWGSGDVGGSDVEPPVMTFDELCVPPTPPVVDFTADPASIVAGQCSTLEWIVENAEFVVLDGEGVRAEDSRYVCPSQTQTYELEVLNGAGEFVYEVTINVSQPTSTPPPTSTPTPAPTAASTPSNASPPTRLPTAVPSLGGPSPSPSVTSTPTRTSSPTVVAIVPVATTPSVVEIVDPPQQGATAGPPQEGVGLSRILLLLGVGAGTLGFGGLVFIGILVLLMVIYLRARTQFDDEWEPEQ